MPDKTFEEQNMALTELAVNKWVSIVSACLLASETGRLIINLGSLEAQKDGARRIVQSIIGTRSPRTACARANSMLSFMRWAFEESPEVVQPFDEDRVWRYLCHLQGIQFCICLQIFMPHFRLRVPWKGMQQSESSRCGQPHVRWETAPSSMLGPYS